MLGIAALLGWDADVVARVGKRCAELFGVNKGREEEEEWNVDVGGEEEGTGKNGVSI